MIMPEDFFPEIPHVPRHKPECQHSAYVFTTTPEGPHYAKETCATCGKFLRWVPKPETVERCKANQAKVEALKVKQLTAWERSFLLSLEKQGYRYSPKQQECLDRIWTEKGGTE